MSLWQDIMYTDVEDAKQLDIRYATVLNEAYDYTTW